MADGDPVGPSTPFSPRSERRGLRARDHHSTVAPSPGIVPIPDALAAFSPLQLRDASSPGATTAYADVSSASATVISPTPHVAALHLTHTHTHRREPRSQQVFEQPQRHRMWGHHVYSASDATSATAVGVCACFAATYTASDGTKKFRSGVPPQAPTLSLSFHQCAKDPHALRQWKMKVQAWELRASQHVPPEELGSLLIEALSGDPALLCQDLPLAELYTVRGVQRILDQLAPLDS
eukprot:5696385-Amphidinium_carterae.1